MNTTLAYLRSRRAWLVRNVAVWGSDKEAEMMMIAAEQVGSDLRIGFWVVSLGGQFQEISFSDLIDSRGNALPEEITTPAVIIIPKSRLGAFVKSVNGNRSFSVARADNNSAPVLVDIMVFETG